MPKKGKYKGKLGGRHRSYGGDVTLNDFANTNESRPGPSRIKKTYSNSVLLCLEEENLNLKEDLDLNWFDRDEEDFCADGDATDQKQLVIAKGSGTRKKRTEKISVNKKDDSGVVYSPDIWFILSDYILPGDVGRFAGICRSAYEVTQTSKFWINLYKSYQTPLPTLPLRLQSQHIACKMDGLRTSIIRSLFYFYGPFIERHKLNQEQQPHSLLGSRCISIWHQKGKVLFNYFFKMEDQSEAETEVSMEYKKKSGLTHYKGMLGNMYSNSEKRFKVLQVTSRNFLSIPPSILGNTLLSVSSGLSNDCHTHTLRMIFGPSHTLRYYPKGKLDFSNIPDGSTGILLNTVVMTKVLNWWSPNYPCISAEDNSIVYRTVNPTPQQDDQQADIYF